MRFKRFGLLFMLALFIQPASQFLPGECTHPEGVEFACECWMPETEAPQIAERFVTVGLKWPQPNGLGSPLTITYSYSNLTDGGISGISPENLITGVENALGLWASVAPLRFVEVPDSGLVPDGTVDNWYDGTNAPNIRFGYHEIDGKSGIAAHSYYPVGASIGLSGDVHFDVAENWDRNGGGLFVEACLHEIGHSLGLAHVGGVNAIMNASLKSRFDGLNSGYLLQDDIAGVQSIYGAGVGSVQPLGVSVPPTPIAPLGVTDPEQPMFEWMPVAGAVRYELTFEDMSTGALLLNKQPVNGTSYSLAYDLEPGPYSWRVRTVYSGGATSTWSGWADFVVEASFVPSVPTPLAPIGVSTSAKPLFEWLPAEGANRHQMRIKDAATGVVPYTSPKVEATSYQMTQSLPPGLYLWKVRGIYPDGSESDWSEWADFAVGASVGPPPPPPASPSIPTPLAPVGTTESPQPFFEWLPAEGLTRHQFRIKDAITGLVPYTSPKVDATTYLLPQDLPPGLYMWKVRGVHIDGSTTDWSDWADFAVESSAAAALPLPLSPIGVTTSARPLFEWLPADGATRHQMRIKDELTGLVPYTSPKIDGTSHQITKSLPPGLYLWKVRGVYSDGSTSDWSDWADLVITN